MPLNRSLAEILALHADVIKNDIRKVLPATVTAVHFDTDPSTGKPRQTVDVQIAVNNPIFDDLGNTFTELAPSVSNVPVGFMRGGGFMVSLPVAIGDSVLLIFSDLSCDVWREGDGTPQDPGFVGKHTLDSAFAIPCIAPDANAFTDPTTANAAGKLVIGKDGSAAQIRISATDIELGNNATDNVVLASLIYNELKAIAKAFSTFAPGTGGANFPNPYVAPVSASAVGSSLIKGQ